MQWISFVLLCCSILVLGIGLFIFQLSGLQLPDKTRATNLVSLLQDGLSAFNRRILSSIVQTLLYTTFVLILFSYVTHTPISWTQISAFILGGSIIGMNSFLYFIYSPQRILSVIEKSKIELTPGLKYQFNMASSISFISVGSILTGFLICYLFMSPESVFGYVSGISTAVFFHRISGGIYKASADISSDIVEDYEKRLSGSDERNPTTILNLIGNYAGKINGFNSDVIGSFLIALISCLMMARIFYETGLIDEFLFKLFAEFPIFITAISLLSSIIAYFFCLIRIQKKRVSNVLLEGLYISIFICSISSIVYLKYIVSKNPDSTISWINIFATYFIGLLGAALIGFTSEYLTSHHYRPAKKIASEAEYGASVTFLNAYSVGLKSIGFYFGYLLLLIIPSYKLSGLYGICLSSLGMLSVTSTILIINTFSPLSSVTSKIALLADSKGQSIANCKQMNRIGETSIALGSGYSSGATIMSSLSLILVIITLSNLMNQNQIYFSIEGLMLLIGGLIVPFIANGFIIRKLSLLIIHTIEEVTRQIREIPYLFENKAKPDLIKASDDISKYCNDALIIPGILIVFSPLVIGFFLNIPYLIFYIIGVFLHTISQSFFQANMGEATNSAKHYIQKGHFGGELSPTFKNVLIADTIGDAFKDVLTPSIHIYLKTTVIIAALLVVFIY